MYEPIESLEEIVDEARQRHFTDEEITAFEYGARRSLAGVEALELLRGQEPRLVSSALAAIKVVAPNLELEVPGSTALLETTVVTVLRQAGLAAATGCGDRYCSVLCDLQVVHWDAGLGGEVVAVGLETLRDECRRALGPKHGPVLDDWLKSATRLLVVTAEVGLAKPKIVAEVATAVLDRFSDVARQYPNAQSKISADLDRVLLHTIRGVLPDGATRVFQMLRAFHEAIRDSKFGVDVIEFAYDLLLDSCERHLAGGRATDLFFYLPEVVRFVAASADLADQLDAILESSVTGLYQKYPDRNPTDEHRDKTKRDERLILEHCLFAIVRGGEPTLVRVASDFWLTLRNFRFGGRFITDAYKILFEQCRQKLRGRTRAQLMPVLHRCVHFLSIAADLADKQDEMLAASADELARKYPAFYEGRPSARAYVVRDQEQLLFNLALGLLPGAEASTAGRFSIFGETLLDSGFDAAMMSDSFAILEAACMDNLQAQSVAHLVPRFRKLRVYLEACATLSPSEAEVVSSASTDVLSRFGGEVSRFPRGEEKVTRDLRTVLRTAMVAAAPGGSHLLARGIERFMHSIDQAKMDPGMLAVAYRSLEHAASKKLPNAAWLKEILTACRVAAEAWARLSQQADEALGKLADDAFAAAPTWSSYPGARRRAVDDLRRVLRHCVLAVVPGGQAALHEGMNRFAEAIRASRFQAPALTAVYEALAKSTQATLGKDCSEAVSPIVDRVVEAIGLVAESTDAEAPICDTAVDLVLRKHPAVETQIRGARSRLRQAMRTVLRQAALASIPGGDLAYAQMLELLGEVVFDDRLEPVVVADAYSSLAQQAVASVRHRGKANLEKRIGEARDYLTLMAGLAQGEETILDESWDDLTKKRKSEVEAYADARELTRFDQRMILRSSTRALLPGGMASHDELTALMKTVSTHRNFKPDMLADAYGALQRRCETHLKLGPVKVVTREIEKASRAFAA